MSATSQSELALGRKIDERAQTTQLHESLVAAIEATDDKTPNDAQRQQLKAYRERAILLDEEIAADTAAIEANRTAMENSKAIRRVLAGNADGLELDGDQVAYRTMAAYARDVLITRDSEVGASLRQRLNDSDAIDRAKERLQLARRAPEHTLLADVAGLLPPQHIQQIFQVIDSSRPIVASAQRVELERGNLTYPKITGRPTVADQGTEKTVADTPDLNVSMETATATTYNAGGNLSWQTINWSTPSALDLWFRVAAADYALKTETDAGTVVSASGQAFDISSELSSPPYTYEEYVAAIAAGAGEVYANSGRMADMLYMAPDFFYPFAGTIPAAHAAAFLTGGADLTGQSGGFAGLRFVVSRGLAAGEAIVGDSSALLVAETPGAPVDLRVVEAQIGGLQVGIIGAFEAVVADPGAFSSITAAS